MVGHQGAGRFGTIWDGVGQFWTPRSGYRALGVPRDTVRMTATVLTLFDVDNTLAPGAGGRERCGRTAESTGLPCMAWPRRGAEACSHHITSEELAVVEQLRGRSAEAA